MKKRIRIDCTEPSTWRGVVWGVAFVFGLIFPAEIEKALLLAAGVVAGLGIGVSDRP